MQVDLDALHGSILLKANNGVNRPGHSEGGAADGGFRSFAHALGNICMMGVKNYFHF
jgi:hypothetical protein